MTLNLSKSKAAFVKAQLVLPGGVNSPVRAYSSVGADPVFIATAKGAYLTDIDGNRYIDYVSSWGPMILGHAHEAIVEAVQKVAEKGTSFGAPTLVETEMAELICHAVASIDKIRFVSSGTEATISAIRLARGYTRRDVIIKFNGAYHGHGDSFLIKAGSGAATFGVPNSPGVTEGTAKDTLVAEYNDLASVQKLFDENAGKIAAVIIEPVAGNMGCVPAGKEFLNGLRQLCTQNGSLLIFDEVITGFRLFKGGAQTLYGVSPDITTYGKIIGAGMPVGAYGGRGEIFDKLAPEGPVYQAGTLSGNPLAMTAGSTLLKILIENPEIYEKLESKANKLEQGLNLAIANTGTKAVVNRVGSMMTMFFTDRDSVNTWDDAGSCETEKYAAYFRASLEAGIYLAPAQFECMFVSDAHTDEDIEKTIAAAEQALQNL
jgi:glutamate-1-semialdehyde 2,1-aminomutase